MEKKDKLRKLQLEELSILLELNRVCEKNKIKYFIAYGTALGAIRHKGFIPWDDDVDTCLLPEDYLKFEKIAKKELNEKYFLQNNETDKEYYLFWNKIRKNKTISKDKEYGCVDIHWGICIDIFPLFKQPTNKRTAKKHILYIKICLALLESVLYKYKLKEKSTKKSKLIYKIITIFPRKFINKITKLIIYKMLNYKGPFDNYVDYSELYNKGPLIYPKEIFSKIEYVDFEKEKLPIMKKYDEYLTLAYGDYMKMPDEKDRQDHGDIEIEF